MIVLFIAFMSNCKGGGSNSSLPENGDVIPPAVFLTSPVNGAPGVPENVIISATFSEEINTTPSANSFIVNTIGGSGGAAVSGTLTYVSSTKTVTFQPSGLLSPQTIYSVTITTDVEDLAGNRMAAPFNWSFTTGTGIDNSPPSFPVNGSELSASATSSTSIALSWSSATDNLTPENQLRYQVCRSTLNSPNPCKGIPFPTSGVVVTNIASGTTHLEITGLIKNTTYYFVVRVKDLVDLIDENTFESSAKTGGEFVQLGSSLNQDPNGIANATNPSIALVGNTPYLTWQEGSIPSKVYVRKFDLNSLTNPPAQRTWFQQVAMNGGVHARNPKIVSDHSSTPIPYITYTECDNVGTNCQVVVKKLNGASWDPVGTAFNFNPKPSGNSAIAFDSNNVPYVVWIEEKTVNGQEVNQVYVAHFPPNGPSWLPDGTTLNFNEAMTAGSPSIAIEGATVQIAWSECPPSLSTCQVYSRKLVGSTWSTPTLHRAGNSGANADGPSLTYANGELYIAWRESGKVYSQKEEGSGFSSPFLVDNASSSASTPLGTTGTQAGTQVPYLAYITPSGKIFVKRWDGAAWVLEGDVNRDVNGVGGITVEDSALNMTGGQASGSFIAFHQGTPYIAWSEAGSCLPAHECGTNSSSQFQMYVKRLE
jgi:hypothetical protein